MSTEDFKKLQHSPKEQTQQTIFVPPNVVIPPSPRFATRAPPQINPRIASMAPIPSPIVHLHGDDQPMLNFPKGVNPAFAASLQFAAPGRQSCPPPMDLPLLDGWSEHFDTSSNSFYYVNENGQRTYDREVACGVIPLVDHTDDDDDDDDESEPSIPINELKREYPEIPQGDPNHQLPPPPLPNHPLPTSVSDTMSPKTPSLKASTSASCPIIDRQTLEQPEKRKKKSKSKREVKKKQQKQNQNTRIIFISIYSSFLFIRNVQEKINIRNLVELKRLFRLFHFFFIFFNFFYSVASQEIKKESADSPSLPGDLQEDINRFQLVGYAEQYFETHKRGIFRRQVPVKEMLCWTKVCIFLPVQILHSKILFFLKILGSHSNITNKITF